jgi:hypothetical protein
MTTRALLLGLALVALLAVAVPYSDLVIQGTWVGLTAFPISSLFLLFVLVVPVNAVLRRLRRGLSTGELLLVYSMTLVAAGIPSFGLTGLLIPYIAGPFYFANPENGFAETIWPLWPAWLHPREDRSVVALYEGLRAGERLPWGDWLVPLAAWAGLALALYATFFGLSAILRRRWVEEERLVFPLVQLPVGLASYREPGHDLPAWLRDPVTWGFFMAPFCVHLLNGLHRYFPAVPAINVHLISLDSYLRDRPWDAVSPFWVRFLFAAIGLAYLLPTELSFSLWFFYFFFLAQQVIGRTLGMPMPSVQAYPVRQFVAHQMVGGIIAYGLYGLWTARSRLREVARAALGRAPGANDSEEAMPYRTAFWAVCGGLLAASLWGMLAGASFAATMVLFALYLLTHIVAVRLVCEGGMLYIQHPFRPFNIMLAAVGSRRLGAQRTAILALLDHVFMIDQRSPLMPGVMQGLKMADAGNLPRRRVTLAMAASVLLAIFVSCAVYLRLMYTHGGTSLNNWFTTYYTRNLYCSWTSHLVTAGEPASPMAFVTMGVGAATMLAIMGMHHTFVWWPVHPIGYLMGASWPMINFWFPVFVAWLVKSLVLRLGGPKVYRRLIPAFMGLVLGEFVSAGIWVLVDGFGGVRGHEVFSF